MTIKDYFSFEKRLKKGAVTDIEAVIYLIINEVLLIILVFPSDEEEENVLISNLIAAVISAIGVYGAYIINKRGDGIDFFKRYCVLSLFVGVKIFIYFLFFLFLYIIFFLMAGRITESENLFNKSDLIFENSCIFIYYCLLLYSFYKVNRMKK